MEQLQGYTFYEVEEFLNKRRNENGELEYLTKWRDLDIEQSTWEPFNYVKYATYKLIEYEQGLKKSDRNYEIDPEIYWIYNRIRINKFFKKIKLNEKEFVEIISISKHGKTMLVKIKWKCDNKFEETDLKLEDCLSIPILAEKILVKLEKHVEN